jgi:multidrug efflux pump subunit AcrB
MLGLIALAGVIINNGIILLDSILHLLEKMLAEADGDQEKMVNALAEAIAEASSIRMRPVFLTTATTVIGMVPLIFVSALWGPLAITIMFGLFFATILTLVLVPLLFYRNPGPQYRHLKNEVATFWGAIKAFAKFVWVKLLAAIQITFRFRRSR